MVMNIQKEFESKNQKVKFKDWHKELKVYYITGPSGIGKSQLAKKIGEDLGYEEFDEVKHTGQFWNGISEPVCGVAIYDDFRDNHLSASEFINFIDYNRHNLNIKGKFVKNNYDVIIITSIQHPQEIYHNLSDEPRQQWLRRMEIIDLYQKLNEDFESDLLKGNHIKI